MDSQETSHGIRYRGSYINLAKSRDRDRQLRDHPHQMQEAFDHKPRPEVKTDSLESGVNEGVRERVKGPLDV